MIKSDSSWAARTASQIFLLILIASKFRENGMMYRILMNNEVEVQEMVIHVNIHLVYA